MPNQEIELNNEDLSPSTGIQICGTIKKTANSLKTNQNNCTYLTPYFSRSFHFDFSPISHIRLPLRVTSKDSDNASDLPSPENIYFTTGSSAVLFGEEFEWETLEVSSDSDISGSHKVVIERSENKNVSNCSSNCRFNTSCCSTWSVLSFVASMTSFVACVIIACIDFDTNSRICQGHETLYLSIPVLVLSAFAVVLKWHLCDVLFRRVIKSRHEYKIKMVVVFLQHLLGLVTLWQASLCWLYKFFVSTSVLMCFFQVILEQLNQETRPYIKDFPTWFISNFIFTSFLKLTCQHTVISLQGRFKTLSYFIKTRLTYVNWRAEKNIF